MYYSETKVIMGGLAHVPILIFMVNFVKGKFESIAAKVVEVKGADHGFMCDQRESFDKDASLIGWNLLMKEFN